jgi:hypothetical protein
MLLDLLDLQHHRLDVGGHWVYSLFNSYHPEKVPYHTLPLQRCDHTVGLLLYRWYQAAAPHLDSRP